MGVPDGGGLLVDLARENDCLLGCQVAQADSWGGEGKDGRVDVVTVEEGQIEVNAPLGWCKPGWNIA